MSRQPSVAENFRRAGYRQQQRPRGFGPSVLLTLQSVDAESNTLTGKIVGGPRDGEVVEGVSCSGRTKPAHIVNEKHLSHYAPEVIEAGEANLVVDGLKEEKGKFVCRWMRHATPNLEVSTPDHAKWMGLVPLRAEWEVEEGEKPVRKYAVFTVDTGAGVHVKSVEELREAYIGAAGRRNGFSAVHLALHGPEGRNNLIQYSPRAGEDKKPVQSPEERYQAFVEANEGEEGLSKKAFGKGYTMTVSPLTARTLSKFETQRLVETEGRLDAFSRNSHGFRLARAIAKASDQDKKKVEDGFKGWAAQQGYKDVEDLRSAPDGMVEKFAAAHGQDLPRMGVRAYLPAAFAVRYPDEDGRPPAMVTHLVQTAQAVPAAYMPVAGDEDALKRYYKLYDDVAKGLIAAPALDAGKPAAQPAPEAEAAAAAEAAPEAEVEAEAEEQFDEQLEELMQSYEDSGEEHLPEPGM